jgi:poly(A) polymerase
VSETLSPPWLTWPQAQALIKAFADAKTPLRFVGGCVRDAVLGRPVKDIDAATPLLPEATMALLKKAEIKAIPTGIEHGTITAVIHGKNFEITTLRKDVSTDGRHAKVEYTDDWEEDAARRDFTINALYLSHTGELFDYFNGARDASEGHVRFIGNAEERIREDYLRILRFFRFYAWYGKSEPDKEALFACQNEASHIAGLSGERMQQEMLKLLAAHASHLTIDLMQDCAVLPHVLGFTIRDTRILARLDALSAIEPMPSFLKLMGFILASDIPTDAALDSLCAKLRLPGAMAEALQQAFLHYDEIKADMTHKMQKKLLRKLGAEHFSHAVLARWARGSDAITANHPYAGMLKLAKEWQSPQFPVTGDDLIALGINPGKNMGVLLQKLEDQWEESDYALSKEQLLQKI